VSEDASGPTGTAVIDCIVQSADFQRVLRTAPWAKSTHFAVHHLASVPHKVVRQPKLSTGTEAPVASPVDDSGPKQLWLGAVVPKRHARRAVTRSLLKRQIRHAVMAAAPAPVAGQTLLHSTPADAALRPGLWVVRLRAPFDRTLFPSAASEALRRTVHEELAVVMGPARMAPMAAPRPDRPGAGLPFFPQPLAGQFLPF
jgi:ribonuclease P protein component